MQRSRILLMGLTSMLGDLVRGVVDRCPDLEIVGEIESLGELAAEGGRLRPDVVLTRYATDDLPVACRELMTARPRTRVVVLTDRGKRGSLWRMRPYCVPLESLSPETLVHALRQEEEPA